MIRAAAKNHAGVTVVVDPEDYARVLAEMARHGGATASELRKALAAKAYARTAAYDAAIARLVRRRSWASDAPALARASAARLAQELRYGENPHQRAAFYSTGDARPGVATAAQHQGKELSYNNLNDTDAAFELVAEFDPRPRRPSPSSSTPIRAAWRCGATLAEAYAKALRCDPGQRLRRHHRAQRPLDAATARGDHRHLHRGGDRAGRRPTRPRRSSPRRRTCAC